MHSRRSLLVLTLTLLFATAAPALADADGNVNFLIGQKSISDADTDPLDDGFAFGAIMTIGQDDWPVGIAVDVLGYVDQEDDFDPLLGDYTITGATFEAAVGVRKIWRVGNARPYVGAGFGVVGAAVDVEYDFFPDENADGAGFGPWVGAGAFWRLGERFNIGFDARWNSAEVDLDIDGGGTIPDVNVGGFSYGLTLGFGW